MEIGQLQRQLERSSRLQAAAAEAAAAAGAAAPPAEPQSSGGFGRDHGAPVGNF